MGDDSAGFFGVAYISDGRKGDSLLVGAWRRSTGLNDDGERLTDKFVEIVQCAGLQWEIVVCHKLEASAIGQVSLHYRLQQFKVCI